MCRNIVGNVLTLCKKVGGDIILLAFYDILNQLCLVMNENLIAEYFNKKCYFISLFCNDSEMKCVYFEMWQEVDIQMYSE